MKASHHAKSIAFSKLKDNLHSLHDESIQATNKVNRLTLIQNKLIAKITPVVIHNNYQHNNFSNQQSLFDSKGGIRKYVNKNRFATSSYDVGDKISVNDLNE